MSKTFITTILILVVVAVAGYFWLSMEQKKAQEELQNQANNNNTAEQGSPIEFNNDYQAGMNSREAGDYLSAAEAFELAIANAPDEPAKALAQRRAGIANFLTGDQQRKIEGINQLKESIAIVDDPKEKAIAIEDLASVICGSGCDAEIFAEVFKDEPYSQFYYPDDLTRSVTSLHEWAISVYPLSTAYVRASTWYADQLLLDDGSLSADLRQQYTNTLASYLAAAREEIGWLQPGSRSELSYYFWEGYAYGALATVDEERYGAEFENSYRKSIALGKFEPDGSNKNYSVLFAYYQYASLLEYLYGDARSADIEENLQALIRSVNGDPNPENNQFLLMARNELSVEGLQHGFIGQSLTTLAEKYPYFKEFMESHSLPI